MAGDVDRPARCALALGISAYYTVFSLMNGLLFRDMPFDGTAPVVAIRAE